MWEPGRELVVDESMIAWRGGGGAHKTYLPRKPTPLGIGLKTTACGATGVMMYLELLEGKEVDKAKAHVREWGSTAGTTVRLVESWAGSGRICIADSWFGSVQCAVALMKKTGLFSIMNVKTGHKRYPKQRMLADLCERGDQVHYVVDVPGEEWKLFASGHVDKQPMCLVHTAGSSLRGEETRRRVHRWYDAE